MAADIVSGGLGGDGPIVTSGLGLTEPAAPGSIRAALHGSGTLTATLTAADTGPQPTPAVGGYFGGYAIPVLRIPDPIPGHMSAALHGTSTLTAHLDFTLDFDDELEHLLMLGIV